MDEGMDKPGTGSLECVIFCLTIPIQEADTQVKGRKPQGTLELCVR